MTTPTNNQIFTNWWWKYVTRVNYLSVKCDICNKICSRKYVPVHLYRFHDITDQEVILEWNNDNHIIWQHFTKTDLFSAKCKFCGRLLKSAYEKRRLDTHLRSIHKQEIAAIREEITRTWVSPHFTFDHKCNIKCIHCSYSDNIYDGVDVLKNHLNLIHNSFRQYFIKCIKKELDYLETTMQFIIRRK